MLPSMICGILLVFLEISQLNLCLLMIDELILLIPD